MTRLLILALVALVVVSPARAHAQDPPKVGVTMGYPPAIGMLWSVSERVALRPEFTFSTGSSETSSSDSFLGSSTTTAPNDSWQTGAGLSALFYIDRREGLRTYVSPRFAYTKSRSDLGIPGAASSTSSDGWSYTTSGSFGAQYSLGRHFGVFGETGLSYTSITSRLTLVETLVSGFASAGVVVPRAPAQNFTVRSDTHSHTLGIRTGAGVIVFF